MVLQKKKGEKEELHKIFPDEEEPRWMGELLKVGSWDPPFPCRAVVTEPPSLPRRYRIDHGPWMEE